ncbi:MAG TPA: PPC domain-containing DNA-binding protein [Acidobacteriaceae bacterium]|jgi:predicted DNA-binding protein with PD1-like motif
MTKRRRLLFLAAALAMVTAIDAQETRRTIKNPSANPADDSKANSSAVPDAYAVVGHFDRIVVVRLKYKANLLEGMKKIVQEQHIRNGVILSAAGSLRGYEIHTVSNRDMPSDDTFVKNPTQPADLVSMNGYVINGRIHAHMTIATPDRVIAGHVEEGNQVFTFAIVTIGVMNGANFDKLDDKTYR